MHTLAVNEFTTIQWTFDQDVAAYANANFQGIGVVRDKVEAYGVERAKRLLVEHSLHVTDVCIAGWFVQPEEEAFVQRVEDARRGIEMAAELEADALILLVGPSGDQTFEMASSYLYRALEQIVPYAEQHGARLAIEPCNPMFRAEASFLMTLGEALDVCEKFESPALGVWLDTYHLWWDNSLFSQLPRAQGRILGVHVNDFKQETKSLRDQTIPGEGVIPLRRLLDAIESAGWNGTYTVEIFSDSIQPADYQDVLQRCRIGFDKIWKAG